MKKKNEEQRRKKERKKKKKERKKRKEGEDLKRKQTQHAQTQIFLQPKLKS